MSALPKKIEKAIKEELDILNDNETPATIKKAKRAQVKVIDDEVKKAKAQKRKITSTYNQVAKPIIDNLRQLERLSNRKLKITELPGRCSDDFNTVCITIKTNISSCASSEHAEGDEGFLDLEILNDGTVMVWDRAYDKDNPVSVSYKNQVDSRYDPKDQVAYIARKAVQNKMITSI